MRVTLYAPTRTHWKTSKTRINNRPVIPKSLDEMWVALQEEWGKIDMEFINKLVDGMPDRAQAVHKAKGSSTKY